MAKGVRSLRVRAPTGERLHVEVRGSGPAVILSNGVGVSFSYWKYLAPRLARSHTVVLWDYPGHGGSERAADPRTCDVPHLVEDLEAVRRAVRARHVVFVGHSFGVQLVLAYWERHPHRVRALVPMFGTHERPMDTFFVPCMDRIFPLIYRMAVEGHPAFEAVWRLVQANPLRMNFHLARLAGLIHPTRCHWEDFAPYLDHYRVLDVRAFFEMARSMQETRVSPFLARVDVPTLVLGAGRDLFSPPSCSRALAEAIPGARYVEIADASHAAPLERPREIGDAVVGFLRGLRGSRGRRRRAP
ncbi:MAG: alpha/beta hydrolase [Planctomycetes bacterium]|nr:alpha/beta hydrolase [Planctomycetota bacterium]